MAYDICPNCGQPIKQDTKFCANCGAKLDTGNLTQANANPQNTVLNGIEYSNSTEVTVKEKRSKKPLIILAVIVALAIVVGSLFFIYYQKQAYKTNMRSVLVEISNGAIKAEQIGNLVISVWYNSIWQVSDDTTDQFTKTNGKFNDNFNNSLDKLYENADFNNSLNDLRDNQKSVLNYMQKLNNPPKDYEEAYNQLKTIYQDYLTLTQLVLSPSGSYNTFTDAIKNTDVKLATEVQTVLIHLE